MTISTDNYTIGQTALYYKDEIGAASLLSSPTGFRNAANDFGNIVSAELAQDISYIEHFISVQGKRLKDKVVDNMQVLQLNFTFDEINIANMTKFFLGSLVGSTIRVFQNTLAEGCAILYMTTNIGNDIQYIIPKCTLKPNGGFTLDPENWYNVPMQLEVLQYISGECATPAGDNASWLLTPFGTVEIT
jgi:hypothetical protein